MDRILSSLNSFLEYASNNKLWALLTSIFVACFWFSINTYINAPNEWLSLNQRRRSLDRIEFEWTVIDAIHGYVFDGVKTSQEAQNTYMEFRKQVTKEQKIPERKVVLDYYQKIIELNNNISRSIGNLDSLRSNNAVIDGYAKEFSADLKAYQGTFDEMENIFVAILKDDDAAGLEHVTAQSRSMIQMPIYLEKTMNRFKGFEDEIDKIFNNGFTELETLQNDTKMFFWKICLSILAVIYMLGFGIVAGRRWYLHSHRKQMPKAVKKRKK